MHQWKGIYEDELPKLHTYMEEMRAWLKKDHRKLLIHLDNHGIYLEPLLSSCFLALFANVIDLKSALRVLDRFVLKGGSTIMQITKYIFSSKAKIIMELDDPFELQKQLTIAIY